MKRAAGLLAALLLGCGPQLPAPGTQSNGTFTFRSAAIDTIFTVDALSIDSRAGLIAVGTTRDLRLLTGSKLETYSEPSTLEITPNRAAEVNGVSVSDDGSRVYAGFVDGLAVIDPGKTGDARLLSVAPLPTAVAQLYRDGSTLYAVSFDNLITALSVANADAPSVLGTLKLEGTMDTVRSATFINHVVTLSAAGLVWVVDVSDGANMKLLARHELEHFIGWSARGPSHLFTGNSGALSVLSMPDHQTLTLAGPEKAEWRMPGNAPLLKGSRLYLFDDQRGFLYVVDVSRPTAPRLLTYLRPDATRVSCERPRASMYDADDVLWVACTGGAVAYVIDF